MTGWTMSPIKDYLETIVHELVFGLLISTQNQQQISQPEEKPVDFTNTSKNRQTLLHVSLTENVLIS